MKIFFAVFAVVLLAAQPAHAEPISGAIGLTQLLATAFGTSAAIGGLASTIGGVLVGGALSKGVRFWRRRK